MSTHASTRPCTRLASAACLLLLLLGAVAAANETSLPSYQQALEAFQAERAAGKGPKVTPQTPDKSLEQVRKDGFPFPILSDLDSSVMRAYGLYFEVPAALSDVYRRNFDLELAAYNGAEREVLPVPATDVIDRDGVVRFAFADTNYRRRVEPEAIVAALKTL